LPYPITISRLLISPGSEITRGTRLLEFSFTSDTSRRVLERARRRVEEGKAGKAEGEDEARENDMVGSWESPVDGTLVEWEDAAKAGTKVEKRHVQ
jgi:RNA polymerase II subunit A-like phosphatase